MINPKNYNSKINEIGIENLSPLLKETHEWYEQAKDFYKKDKLIKETADLYFKKLESFKPLKNKKSPALNGGNELEEELTGASIDFDVIKQFVSYNGKAISKKTILALIHNIHLGISKKLITKNSPFASEIRTIQERLVNIYNNTSSDKIKIVIDRDNLRKFQEILLKKKS